MSTLTAFPYIGEQSFATPGAINSPLSILSANIAAVNAAAGSVSGVTITPPSGNTITIASDLAVLGTIAAGPARLGVNSNVTNYLFLSDTSHARSNYVIGSQVGGTADGLNIWDDSGQTMLVSFSKQSIRFYQNVTGPVFDVGGALASTLNAATFGGSLITTQIQAAISAASNAIPKIKRVYIPASMYPYDPRQISYDTNVQMVREGGSWDVYDVQAYGANPTLSVADAWSTTGIQRALNAAQGAGGGITYVPTGNYAVSSLTVGRSVTLRGAGGGRHLDATTVAQLYQASAATTLLFLADQGGSGTIIENIQLSASGNNNSLGIVQVAGMSFTLLRNVAISVGSAFGVRYLGGADTNYNALLDCAITVSSFGTAVDVSCNSTAVCDSTPYMAGCFVTTNSPAQAWLSFRSVSGGNAPDSPIIVNNRFFSSSTLTAVYGQVTNARILGNRFEVIGGGLNVTLASPDGEPPAEFVANSYGLTGGTLIWTDTSLVVATRFQELVGGVMINAIPGTAIVPSYALGSENSLGWYRSAASTMALSYGTLALPSGLTATGAVLAGAGTALSPAYGFVSENSLGLFRSGKSSLALSYGSWRLPAGAETVFIASGTNPPMRLWNSTSQGLLSVNRDLAFNPDNNAFASWMLQITTQAGAADNVTWAHTIPAGASATKWSLDSLGNVAGGPGTAANPSYQFLSEASLGLYRSASSTLAMSYGTFDLTAGGAVTSIASLKIKSGANNSCGTAVLGSNGSVNVANTYVAAGDLIFLTDQTAGGTLGDIELGGIRAGSGFTILSTSITDSSTVAWLIVRPT